MIKIVLKNGRIVEWKKKRKKKKRWTDYKYDGKCFSVINNNQVVGIYNMDSIISVIIK